VSRDLDLLKEKVFLIVFHGGMVGYLWLHNLAIPLLRNLGTGQPILLGIHFWFLYHTFIFYYFFRYDIVKSKPSKIPFLIDSSMYMSLFGIVHMGIEFAKMDKPNLDHFSSTISLASIMIFYLGFFVHFKKFLNWEIKNKLTHYLSSAGTGIALFLFLYNLELHFATAPEWAKREPTPVAPKVEKKVNSGPGGCDPNFKTFSFSKQQAIQASNESRILECGLAPNVVKTGPEGLIINNLEYPKVHMRLEYFRKDKWVQRKVVTLKREETDKVEISFFKEPGLYRLRSSTVEKLGIQIILHDPTKIPGNFDIPVE
jgi:hypothetical protein